MRDLSAYSSVRVWNRPLFSQLYPTKHDQLPLLKRLPKMPYSRSISCVVFCTQQSTVAIKREKSNILSEQLQCMNSAAVAQSTQRSLVTLIEIQRIDTLPTSENFCAG